MRYRITVEVDYDEATVSDPDRLLRSLERNVARCIDRNDLLNDGELEEVIDQYSAEVERVS